MIEVAFAIPELGQAGPHAVFRTILRHIDRERFRPSVIVMEGGAKGDVDGAVVDEVAAHKYPVLSTRHVLRRRRPDIVLSTLRMNETLALASPGGEGGPAHVVRIPNHITRKLEDDGDHMSRPRRLAVESTLALTMARADAVVAQTDVMRDDLRQRYGATVGRKTTVIHNPVDVERLRARAEAEPVPFAHDGPLLVSVGRLSEQKGFDLLLSALRDVVDVHPDAHLVLVGEGPDQAALEERARHLGLTGHVTFLGQLANPFPLVASADLYVLSSRYEGFSNALAEAQGLGVPAVAVGGDATGDVILAPETGIVVPTPEPTHMAEAIVTALSDLGRFDRDAIVRSIDDRFNAGRITALYEDMLEATLEVRATADDDGRGSTRTHLGAIAAPVLGVALSPRTAGVVPSFVCIGAGRAGTNTLWEYLKAHPEVSLPRSTEVDYFVDRPNPSLRDYSRRFRDCDPHLVVGDVSPRYASRGSAAVARAMARTLPDARVVYILREPADRMRSHYRHEVLRSRETRYAQWAADDDLYLAPSLYGSHLAHYLDHFPGENVLLVDCEALRVAPEATLAEVFAFIGADPTVAVPAPAEVYTAATRAPESATAERLRSSRLGRLALDRMTIETKVLISEAYGNLQNPDTARRAHLLMGSAVHWAPSEETTTALKADGERLIDLLPAVAGFVGGGPDTVEGWRQRWGRGVEPAPPIPDDEVS